MLYELDDIERRALMNMVVDRARADLNEGRPLTEMKVRPGEKVQTWWCEDCQEEHTGSVLGGPIRAVHGGEAKTWFDEQLAGENFDIDACYKRIHRNHMARGIPAKWSDGEGLNYTYCLAQGDFEHRGPYCGHRVPEVAGCDSCGMTVPESEVKGAMTSAGVEGMFCHDCRHGKGCDCGADDE
jgi:hypothetical protein